MYGIGGDASFAFEASQAEQARLGPGSASVDAVQCVSVSDSFVGAGMHITACL